jgi:hypothetical protein
MSEAEKIEALLLFHASLQQGFTGNPPEFVKAMRQAADLIRRLAAENAALNQEVGDKCDSINAWRANAMALEEENAAQAERIKGLEEAQATEQMFPIMGGPSVPWSLIAPYEHQAQKNHRQTLKRLAERGGLSICEAMAVMSSARYENRPIAKPTVEDWLDFIAARKARASARAALEPRDE